MFATCAPTNHFSKKEEEKKSGKVVEMKSCSLLLLLVALSPANVRGLWGDSRQEDVSDLTEYIPGELRMILSVPHGGEEDVESIPEREDGCPLPGADEDDEKEERCDFAAHDESCADEELCGVTTVTDTYTIEIALAVSDRLNEVLGARPHVVICHLKRCVSIHEASATFFLSFRSSVASFGGWTPSRRRIV